MYVLRDRTRLQYQEQSVLQSLAADWKLEEKGQLVYMDPPVYNDYAGEEVYVDRLPVFQQHFPSLEAKSFRMVPLIKKLQDNEWKYKLDEVSLLKCKSKILDIISQFWASRKKNA